MNIKEILTTNQDTKKFAEHFNTKSNIKNLLKGYDNAKALQVLFEESKYADELIGYGELKKYFLDVVSDTMVVYTAEFKKWKSEADTRSLPDRVQWFVGAIEDRLEKKPGKEIAAALGDFMKSATGKEIEKIVKDAGIDEKELNDTLMDLLLMIAVRKTIILMLTEDIEKISGCEVVDKDGNPIKDSSNHSKSEEKKEEKKADNESTEIRKGFNAKKEEFNGLYEKLKSFTIDTPDADIDAIATTIRPFFLNGSESIANMINGYNHKNHSETYRCVQDILPVDKKTKIDTIEVDKLVEFVSDICYCKKTSDVDELDAQYVMAIFLTYSALDAVLNPDNADKFNLFTRTLVRVMSNPVEYCSKENRKRYLNLASNVAELVERVNGLLEVKVVRTGFDLDLFYVGEAVAGVGSRSRFKGVCRWLREELAA